MSTSSSTLEDIALDVIIVGAGISGINAAYQIQTQLPSYTYKILEARDDMGGTWDLFRYPGIRSDSDLYTFGFPWHPWHHSNPIAEGSSIQKYIREAASLYGLDRHILFKHHVSSAAWSSEDQLWTITTASEGHTVQYMARFIVLGTGYYDYHEPLAATIPGLENFKGQVIHPQFWPEHFDYADQKIVVIGSGATAVTLLPTLAEKAAHVTMLQRSPSYILSLPNQGPGRWMSRILPEKSFYKLQRLSWIILSRLFFLFCQRFPTCARFILKKSVTSQLPKDISFDPHFNPRYNPWDQRLCVCPDGDFFKALHSGRANIGTGIIQAVLADGIQLKSGRKLDADIIVTATGLKLQIAGGIRLEVDGKKINVSEKYMWNGVMLQDVPNMSVIIGHTNASWTLGADITANFMCRILKYLDHHGYMSAIPDLPEPSKLKPKRLVPLKSTYIYQAEQDLPKASDQAPWKPRDNYFADNKLAKSAPIDRGMRFVKESDLKIYHKTL